DLLMNTDIIRFQEVSMKNLPDFHELQPPSLLPTQLGAHLQYLNYRVIKKNPELCQMSIRIHPAADNVAHEIT
ncbi:hypothetical protein ACJO72_22645, partial [Citrobacter freundii]|uniref:hypothetical protein n=1 Tax=Citrobacter freundii TaxID=546 RepID=UPI003EDA24E4